MKLIVSVSLIIMGLSLATIAVRGQDTPVHPKNPCPPSCHTSSVFHWSGGWHRWVK
jgi:hypothetical protein